MDGRLSSPDTGQRRGSIGSPDGGSATLGVEVLPKLEPGGRELPPRDGGKSTLGREQIIGASALSLVPGIARGII